MECQEAAIILFKEKEIRRTWYNNEWKESNITDNRDYAILTAEICRATFNINPSEYKRFKRLPDKANMNLRDNMTDLELIFTMLGERVTTEISQTEKPAGISNNKKVAQRGGNVAGNAHRETEKELGKSMISNENYLSYSENKKVEKEQV